MGELSVLPGSRWGVDLCCLGPSPSPSLKRPGLIYRPNKLMEGGTLGLGEGNVAWQICVGRLCGVWGVDSTWLGASGVPPSLALGVGKGPCLWTWRIAAWLQGVGKFLPFLLCSFLTPLYPKPQVWDCFMRRAVKRTAGGDRTGFPITSGSTWGPYSLHLD